MSKRTVFTTITPLPTNVTRQHVMETLRNHVEMIDLNPLVEERHPIRPPPKATPEEFHCVWYLVTDRVQYLPGGLYSGKISYPACFHDLPTGIQTHIYAPMGLDIKGKWTLGGSLLGEPQEAVEMGLNVPMVGLYVREDVDMRCNILMTNFVKKTLKKAHAELVGRLSVKAQLSEAATNNNRINTLASSASPQLNHASSLRSPIGSPGFQSQNSMMSPDSKAMRSQSPKSPGQMQMNSYQQYDPRISVQSSSSFHQQLHSKQQFPPSELSSNEETKQVEGAMGTHVAPVELPAQSRFILASSTAEGHEGRR